MGKSDLPFGSEFSPSQIDLIHFLELAKENSGDWRTLEDSIRQKYFDSHPTSEYNRRKLANNCKSGMIAYGVLQRDGTLTDLGKRLLSLKNTPEKLYQVFGRHKTVLYPLEKAGYIFLERGTKKTGRGAKPFQVKLTDKIKSELITPLMKCLQDQSYPDLRPLLRKSLDEILKELSSEDRHIKGLALEALAFYLMRLIDLKYVATRLRGQATGGAEVDLIFEGARLIFSRWQIQCKNTKFVSLDDVAKEVGLTFQLKSNVVMVVSTGKISSEARKYANQVMSSTNLNIVLLDSDDLQNIAENPTQIVEALNREARGAMKIKKLELF